MPNQRRNRLIGLALLGIGLVMLFGRLSSAWIGGPLVPHPPMLPMRPLGPIFHDAMMGYEVHFVPGMILLTIASCFLFFAFWRKIYPLLIPGGILTGLALGVPFAGLTNGASVLYGLSLGFLGIYLVGRDLFHVRNPWPIFPAVPLFAVGTIIVIASLPLFFALANGMIWLPLLLIGAGLYLGWGRQSA